MRQPDDLTPTAEWTSKQLREAAQRLRRQAFAAPCDVIQGTHRIQERIAAGAPPQVPEGVHRTMFRYQGHEVQLQISLDVGLPRGAGMLHLSCSSRSATERLPESLVQEIVAATFHPDERWTEAPSLLHPGVIRQFILLIPPGPFTER